MKKTVAFLGAGNMGYPILKGAVRAFGKDQVIFRCAHKENNERISTETGVEFAASTEELVKKAQMIVLAVKPQYYSEILPQIKSACKKDQIIISLAPGISISYLQDYFDGSCCIVRAMPNTPALVSEGLTTLCFSQEHPVSDEVRELVTMLFSAVGKISVLPERLMDAAMIAGGCSPAFMYLFIEALADGAVKYGIPRRDAYQMAAQSMIGAGKMVLETAQHPGVLKDAVCSPGGTTIAGVSALEAYGFRNAVIKACDACYEKATQMKK